MLPPMKFKAKIWQWRGPAPYYFVTVPDEESVEIKHISKMVTYGWGMIPAAITVNKTTVKTALFYKNGNYIVPLKLSLRTTEKLLEGDEITIALQVG